MRIVTGVMDALRKIGAKKIVVGTPYHDEIKTAEAEFLVKNGFDVLDIQRPNPNTRNRVRAGDTDLLEAIRAGN